MTPARTTFLFGAGLVALMLVFSSVFIVDQTEQALILQFGKPERVERTPGLQFKYPWQNVEFYDKRLLEFNASPKEFTAADQKRVVIDSFVRYRITDPLRFKQAVGDERTMGSRLNTILEASLRQALGKLPLSTMISSERASFMREVQTLVNLQAAGRVALEGAENAATQGGFGIDVVDVRIVRADLPVANSESIFKRMQTEREREAKQERAEGAEEAQKIKSQADKERTIILAEADKKASILRGEGDAAATKLFAQAYGQDEEFYKFFRTLQAYRTTLSGKDTTMILSPNSEFLRTLDAGSGIK